MPAARGSDRVTGHVNAASGHGAWPEGLALLAELASRGR
jgi:predicted alpha/beta hydrolase family esterase